MPSIILCIRVLTSCIFVWLLAGSANADDTNTKRTFEFEYGAAVTGLTTDSPIRVWIPIATTNAHQQIELLDSNTPSKLSIGIEKKYNNRIGYFETSANNDGKFSFNVKYRVTRSQAKSAGPTKLTEVEKQVFLSSNRLVPVDGRPAELIKQVDFQGADTRGVARRLYDVVESHMKYDKSKPGYGTGNSTWACDSRTGNCTDFHSLFISLSRSRKIPARFEIGFPIPSDQTEGAIGGYHCWAWFYDTAAGWTPVDISEADKHPEMKEFYFGNLSKDRVAFSTGRDIELVPKSQAGPLNYLVYPYIEVNGEPMEKKHVDFRFQFKNVDVTNAK
jgi:hypothetical protein